MDRYVVVGNPVGHSKSPLIHTAFAQQTGQQLEYSTLLSDIDCFTETMQEFFNSGGKGANVTVPFKQEACALAKHLTLEASTAGAVNTLYLDEQQHLCGHNTDGLGLVRDVLANHGGSLAGKQLLVLGAGGATRGILQPFLAQKPASLFIANRTVSKAEELASAFSALAEEAGVESLSGGGFDDLAGRQFDWVFNATSASLQGDLPPLPEGIVTQDTWCYDLMYSNEPTAFCQWAENSGAANVMDGLGMLVEQAAESFLVWRGIRPETADILARLRQS